MRVRLIGSRFARPVVRCTSWLAAATLAACTAADKTPGTADSALSVTATAQACAGDNAGLTLPSGFCASIFADSIKGARHVVVASNGDVYTTLDGSSPAPNAVKPGASFVAMRDTNRDGRADIVQRIGTLGNTGIALANGHLYVDEGTRIVRYTRADTQLAPTGKAEVIVDGFPLNPGHRARNFAIGTDGGLYVNIGSATNSCQQKDRATESPGVDPCIELQTRAGIWKFDANKTGQRYAASARFATGIRNGMGIAFGNDGKLYATQHGRDQLHDNWPSVFPAVNYQAENPAEELLQVNENDDFGWPYCYYGTVARKLVDAPEYGGNGTTSGRCDGKKAPVAVFPGHWAPMSLLFHSGQGNFPARYRSGAFIAFHGSWNRAPEPQAGYRVVFQPMTDGAASGAYETFADGFSGLAPDKVQPDAAMHRPMGLAIAPDGAMFITDDKGGRIYRITYGAK